jgi:hypothetical protein
MRFPRFLSRRPDALHLLDQELSPVFEALVVEHRVTPESDPVLASLRDATLTAAFYDPERGTLVLETGTDRFALAVPHQAACAQIGPMVTLEPCHVLLPRSSEPTLLFRSPSWCYRVTYNALVTSPPA